MREILTGRDALSQEDPPPPQEEDEGPLTKDTLAEEEDEPTETEDNPNATENNPSEEKELSIDSVETPRKKKEAPSVSKNVVTPVKTALDLKREADTKSFKNHVEVYKKGLVTSEKGLIALTEEYSKQEAQLKQARGNTTLSDELFKTIQDLEEKRNVLKSKRKLWTRTITLLNENCAKLKRKVKYTGPQTVVRGVPLPEQGFSSQQTLAEKARTRIEANQVSTEGGTTASNASSKATQDSSVQNLTSKRNQKTINASVEGGLDQSLLGNKNIQFKGTGKGNSSRKEAKRNESLQKETAQNKNSQEDDTSSSNSGSDSSDTSPNKDDESKDDEGNVLLNFNSTSTNFTYSQGTQEYIENSLSQESFSGIELDRDKLRAAVSKEEALLLPATSEHERGFFITPMDDKETYGLNLDFSKATDKLRQIMERKDASSLL